MRRGIFRESVSDGAARGQRRLTHRWRPKVRRNENGLFTDSAHVTDVAPATWKLAHRLPRFFLSSWCWQRCLAVVAAIRAQRVRFSLFRKLAGRPVLA